MRLMILTGFLGSGKTTLLLRLTSYLTSSIDPKNIVIIENEIGEANVDGLLMSKSGYQVRALTSGCICCTLSGDLLNALREIRNDLNPKWLLVEASGIAHQTIAETINQVMPGLKSVCLVLVDVERWTELMEKLPMLISAQVEKADLILLNKIESASSRAELEAIEQQVREINDWAPLHYLDCDFNNNDVIAKVLEYVCL